jgi:hypothetical protein
MYCVAVSYDVLLMVHYLLFVEILFNLCNIIKKFIPVNCEHIKGVSAETVARSYSSAKPRPGQFSCFKRGCNELQQESLEVIHVQLQQLDRNDNTAYQTKLSVAVDFVHARHWIVNGPINMDPGRILVHCRWVHILTLERWL